MNCALKSVQTDFPYCYEYVGNAEILVITPLKEKMNEERENNPMLYFSSTDPNCMANRRQMSKGGVNQMNSF